MSDLQFCPQKCILLGTREVDNMFESVQEKIYQIFNREPDGTIFSNTDFYHIANKESVKKSLVRLEEKGCIKRLISGFYCKLEYSSVLRKEIYPEPEKLAYKIAERFSWVIVSSSDTVLNELGLSMQVPSIYTYISDGPYREYTYLGFEIKFKHTASRLISSFSVPLLKTIQAIKAIGKDNLNQRNKRILKKYMKENVRDDIVVDARNIPFWIYEILIELKSESGLSE